MKRALAESPLSFDKSDISQGPQLEAMLLVRYESFTPPSGVPALRAMAELLAKRFPARHGQRQENVDRDAELAVARMLNNGYLKEVDGIVSITPPGAALLDRMRIVRSSCGASSLFAEGQQSGYCWNCGCLM